MFAVAIDASRLIKETPRIKGALEVTFKNGPQPGEAAAVGGASHETARVPSLLDTLGPRSPQAMGLLALGGPPCRECLSPAEGTGLGRTLGSPSPGRHEGPVKAGSRILGECIYSSVRSAEFSGDFQDK